MTKKKKNRKKRLLLKVVLWMFLSILLFISGIGTWAYFFAQDHVNTLLSDFVYYKTGTYRVTFDHIEFSRKNWEMRIHDIYFTPDSAVFYEMETHNREEIQLLTIYSPTLKLKNIRLKPLLKDRIVEIKNINISAPDIGLMGERKNEKPDSSRIDPIQIKNAILKYVNGIKIHNFEISDASYDFYQLIGQSNEFNGQGKVTIQLENFEIAHEMPKSTNNLYAITDFRIKLENYSLALKDSIHSIKAGALSFSLLKSTIEGIDLNLSPNHDIDDDSKTRYFIEVPHLYLHSNDVSKLYGSDSIAVNRLALNDAKIDIRVRKKKESTGNEEKELQLDLYELIKNDLSMAMIDSFEINHANIQLFTHNNSTPGQVLNDFTFQLYDFKLDALTGKDKDRILYAKNGIIKAKGLTVNHADSIHLVKAGDFVLNTKQESLEIGNISFSPLPGKAKEQDVTIEINGKAIRMKGIDLKTAFHDRSLIMKKLEITEPLIEISRSKPRETKPQKLQKSLILEKTKSYINGIYVDRLTIVNGKTTLNYIDHEQKSGFFATNFNFNLGKVSLDEETFYRSDKMFMASQFDVNFSNLNLQLADNIHFLKLREFTLSSDDKSASISDLHLYPNEKRKAVIQLQQYNKNQLFDIKVPSLKLRGASFHKAFFDKELLINEFSISRPSIDIELVSSTDKSEGEKVGKSEFYDLLSKYIFSIQLNQFSIRNGNLHMIHQGKKGNEIDMSNEFDIKLSDFLFNSNSINDKSRIFFSKNVDLILRDYTISLSDDVHKFHAKELGLLTSEKRAYLLNGKLYPDITSPEFSEMPLTIKAEVPRLDLLDANFIRAANYQDLKLSEIVFSSPDIELFLQKKQKNKERKQEKTPLLMPQGLKFFDVNQLKIKTGKVKLYDYTHLKKDLITESNIDFLLKSVDIDVDREYKAKTRYGDFKIELTQALFNFSDSIHQATAKRIAATRYDSIFDIYGLQIRPVNKDVKSQKSRINIISPSLSIRGLDYPKLINQQELIAHSIDLGQPLFHIIPGNEKSKKKFNPYSTDFHKTLAPILSYVKVDEIQVNSADLKLDRNKPINLSNIDLNLQNFIIDKNFNQKNRFLNSSFASLNIFDLDGENKSGLYNYSINHLYLNSKGHFSLKDFQYRPNVSKKRYYEIKQAQEDYAKISVPSLNGKIDLQKAVEHDYFHIPTLQGNVEYVDIFRDKRYPFPADRFSKLPQQIARDMKKTFAIDSIQLQLGELAYNEWVEGAKRASKVNVTRMNIDAFSYTNDKDKLKSNPYTRANLEGYLMDESKLKATLLFDIPSLQNELSFKATLDSFPLTAINSMSEPSLKMSIKEGYTSTFNIQFDANENSSRGELYFGYEDLKISILKDRGGEIKEEKFVSFLANSLLLKSRNPRKGKELEPVQFYANRDKQKSVVNYIWLNTFAGIKEVLGLKDRDDKKNDEARR